MSNQQNGSTPPPESLLLPPPPQLFLPSAPNPALSSSSFAQPHHNSRSQLNKKTLSQASTIAPTSSTGRQSLELVSSNSPFTPITSVFNTPSDRQSAPRSSTSIATSTSTTSLSLPAFSQRNSLADNPVFNSAQLSALRGFVSPNTISSNDFGTWETLLAKHKFPATLTPQDAYDLEIATVSLAIELAANNARTKNFNTLLLHLLTQLRRFDPEECRGIIPGETYNALFLVRAFSKHFVGNLSGEEIHRQFEGPTTIHGDEEGLPSLPPPPTIVDHATVQLSAAKFIIDPDVIVDARPKAEQLLDELLTVIVLLDPNASYSAYEFYLEALNTLIALLSTQIYQSSPNANDNNYFLNILMTKFGGRADALIGTLMKHFVAQKPMPPVSASVVYNAYSYFFSSKPTAATTPDLYPLADRSILLILLLSMQSRSSNETRIKTEPNLRANNWTAACRLGISGLRDENTLSVSMSSSSSSNDKAQSNKSREISFRSLYRIVCQSLSTEEVCLLFYLVMVENEAFRVYVLSRTDPDTLFVPILKMVYETMEGKTNYSHVYILLIMLLLFSQDDILNENIQKINLGYQAWFTERPLLKTISLGGLAVLVLIRAIQFNLSNHRDIYFHTNFLATLANMSSSILDIHPYVAQRLVSLFDLVAKRYQKLISKTQTEDRTGESAHYSTDVAVYSDLVSLVLEIINSVLTHHLKNNTQLVYALLHKKDMFAHFRMHPRFSELIGNIEQVINYFNARVAEANLRAPSTEEVLDLIEQAARTWPPNKLRDFGDLRFQYEEEIDSQDFFCPYVWALVYRKTFIYWDEDKAHILDEYRTNAESDMTVASSPVVGS